LIGTTFAASTNSVPGINYNQTERTFMKLIPYLKAALIGAALFATTAHASLLEGKSVRYDYLFPDINTANGWYGAGTYTVGAGVEVNDTFSVDFSDKNVTISYNNGVQWCGCGQSFNGVEFSDSDNSIDSFTSVSLNAATTMAGLTADRVHFDADHIWIDWQNLAVPAGAVVSIDLDSANSTNVPEPTPLALLGLGLAAMTARRKASRR
jgi:hypothetical protein